MKGLRSIRKILKINSVVEYKVSCLFDNGESRIIDFERFFKSRHNYSKKHPSYKLIKDIKEFSQIEVIGNTIGWKNTGIYSKDIEGEEVFYWYEIDPIVLFENSEIDESRILKIGKIIKEAREEVGMPQAVLAKRIGRSQGYISRLENNKEHITILTLKKIIEAGLGNKLKENSINTVIQFLEN